MPPRQPASPLATGEGAFHTVSRVRLRTTYAAFRSCRSPRLTSELKPLPLRVVATDDGHFEVIDGFKRLASWSDEGREQIPVVIESPGTQAEHKRLLLLANAPRRTLNPLDEASIVCSLLEEDGLTVTAVSKLLDRKKVPETVGI